MARQHKPLKLVKADRVTFNRDARHADAKRLHTSHLTFEPTEWLVIEKELHNFLQPNQKLENIEMIYADDKNEEKPAAADETKKE